MSATKASMTITGIPAWIPGVGSTLIDVAVGVDFAQLAADLAHAASRNKDHQASRLGGAVVAKALNQRPKPPRARS